MDALAAMTGGPSGARALEEERPDPIVGMTEVLAVSFAIIGIGFVLRARGVMSKEAGSGIGQLIGKIALPALLFKGMATLDLDDVDFALLGAMALGKLIVFGIAVGYVLLTDKSPARVSVAGVYGVFVTQSNGAAARCCPRPCRRLARLQVWRHRVASAPLVPRGGRCAVVLCVHVLTRRRCCRPGVRLPHRQCPVPELGALYVTRSFCIFVQHVWFDRLFCVFLVHPHALGCADLFLGAPFQLIVLTPLGFVLMEAGNAKLHAAKLAAAAGDAEAGADADQGPPPATGLKLFAKIAKNVLSNPVVFSTLLGLLYNLIVNAPLPDVVLKGLTTMGNAFAVSALFNLGMAMVGRLGVLRGRAVLLPLFLTVLKAVAVPIFCRLLLAAFDSAATDDGERRRGAYAA